MTEAERIAALEVKVAELEKTLKLVMRATIDIAIILKELLESLPEGNSNV